MRGGIEYMYTQCPPSHTTLCTTFLKLSIAAVPSDVKNNDLTNKDIRVARLHYMFTMDCIGFSVDNPLVFLRPLTRLGAIHNLLQLLHLSIIRRPGRTIHVVEEGIKLRILGRGALEASRVGHCKLFELTPIPTLAHRGPLGLGVHLERQQGVVGLAHDVGAHEVDAVRNVAHGLLRRPVLLVVSDMAVDHLLLRSVLISDIRSSREAKRMKARNAEVRLTKQ
jgi:hypothetical protein